MKGIKSELFQVPHWDRDWAQTKDLYAGEAPAKLAADIPGDPTPRCPFTLGNWCKDWWTQTPVSWKPAPRGTTECPGNCNNRGQCNFDSGYCLCQAGWKGRNCSISVKRPCSHRFREERDPEGIPMSNLGPDNHEIDWLVRGWTASRCGGYCDDTLGLCYCGFNSTFRHIPAPEGSPFGTPPIQMGRPMINPCQPLTDEKGRKTDWGVVSYDQLYGPKGWCEGPVHSPSFTCGCALETLAGSWCEKRRMAVCPNQCNLRGVCDNGYCVCDPGWYGTTCDRKKGGLEIEPRKQEVATSPAATDVWRDAAAALPTPPHPTRKRPLIYIYDLPPDYNARLLQYKHAPNGCMWRFFNENNQSLEMPNVYGVEFYIHDILSSSSHRTFDPEEADYFYAPIYMSCYMWPVHGWSDGPWYYVPTPNPRPYHAANMFQEAKDWLANTLPYWNRSYGHDHLFIAVHDEGGCYMPTDIFTNATMLVHWGRTDINHTSGSGWPPDNYTDSFWAFKSHPLATAWQDIYKGHPCFRPEKDIVLPAIKHFTHYHFSPLLGVPPMRRDILAFSRGDVGAHREWWYSRGIRQSLFRLAQEDKWREKHNIIIGGRDNYPGDYSEFLSRSVFCLVMPGDGHSARMEDAMLHGCIPLIIMDNVQGVWENVLDYSQFSVRVPQAQMHDLPTILAQYNRSQILSMQRAISKVWHRFAYTTGIFMRRALRLRYNNIGVIAAVETPRLPPSHPFQPLKKFPVRQDAFHTLMQVLYGRLPAIQRLSGKEGGGNVTGEGLKA